MSSWLKSACTLLAAVGWGCAHAASVSGCGQHHAGDQDERRGRDEDSSHVHHLLPVGRQRMLARRATSLLVCCGTPRQPQVAQTAGPSGTGRSAVFAPLVSASDQLAGRSRCPEAPGTFGVCIWWPSLGRWSSQAHTLVAVNWSLAVRGSPTRASPGWTRPSCRIRFTASVCARWPAWGGASGRRGWWPCGESPTSC